MYIAPNGQQTEDDVYVGKTKTYGNYRGPELSAINPKNLPDGERNKKAAYGSSTLAGTVVTLGWCEEDCLVMWVKKDNGTTVAVGTKDYGFSVPKSIIGKRLLIEGIDSAKLPIEKRTLKKDYQKDIQFATTGIRLMN